MTSKHSNAFQIPEPSRVAIVWQPYDIQCLNRKKGYNWHALVKTWTSSFGRLLFWILLQNTDDEKLDVLDVYLSYRAFASSQIGCIITPDMTSVALLANVPARSPGKLYISMAQITFCTIEALQTYLL